MQVIETGINGVVIIEPKLFKDNRGYFYESFNDVEFKTKVANTDFVQDNLALLELSHILAYEAYPYIGIPSQ